jgi:hypothetical protein
VRRTEERLGLVTVDVVRHGAERIADAILERHRELGLETSETAAERDRQRKRGPLRRQAQQAKGGRKSSRKK